MRGWTIGLANPFRKIWVPDRCDVSKLELKGSLLLCWMLAGAAKGGTYAGHTVGKVP